MKKIILLGLITLAFSCQTQESSPIQQLKNNDGDLSMIEELEANGTKLFKKEVQLFDDTKKNSVRLLIASENKTILEDYLNTTEMSLRVHKSLEDVADNPVKSNEKVDLFNNPNDAAYTTYEDVLSKSMENGVVAYTISYKTKATKNARLIASNGYSRTDWKTSERFDDWIQVNCNSTNNINPDIYVLWKTRRCAFCSFVTQEEGLLTVGSSKRFGVSSNPSMDYDARRLACSIRNNWGNFQFTRGNY